MDNKTVDLNKFNSYSFETQYKILSMHHIFNILPEVIEYICNDEKLLNKILNNLKNFDDYELLPDNIKEELLNKYENEIIEIFINNKTPKQIIDKLSEFPKEVQEKIFKNYEAIVLQGYLTEITDNNFNSGVKLFEKTPVDIKRNLLITYKDEMFKWLFNQNDIINFSQLDEFWQQEIIEIYKHDLSRLNSKKQLLLITEAKNSNLQIKLLQNKEIAQNIFNQLLIEPNGNILYFLVKIKSFEIFKQIYNNPKIFEKLMTENVNNFLKFNYTSFKMANGEVQKYILSSIQNKVEYQKQFTELLKFSSLEIRKTFLTKIPNDIDSICLYITSYPNSIEAKEKLLSEIKKHPYITNEISTILNLYPIYINDNYLSNILKVIDLNALKFVSVKVILNNINLITIFQNVLKQRINNKPSLLTQINQDYLSLLNFNEVQLYNLLDEVDSKVIFNNIGQSFIQDYIIQKLKTNPQYLKEIKPLECFIGDLSFLNYIKEDLSPEMYIYISTNLDEEILRLLITNPQLSKFVNNSKLLIDLYNKFKINDITKNIPLKIYCQACKTKPVPTELMDYCLLLVQENDISYEWQFEGFYKNLNDDLKNYLISNTIYYPNFISYYVLETDKQLKETIANKIIENQDIIFKDIDLHRIIQKLDDDIIYKLNDNNLGIIYLYKQNVDIAIEIMNRFEHNHYIFNNNIYAEETFEKLLPQDKVKIKQVLNNQLDEIFGHNYNLLKKIKNNDTIFNFKLIENYQKGFFNNKKNRETFEMLINNNPYIISTLNFEFLQIDFTIKNKERILKKITKYPEIQEKIVDLQSKNETNFNLFKKLIETFNNEENKIVDRKLMIILNNLENNTYEFNHDLNEKELKNLMRYILMNSNIFKFSKNHIDVKDIDILNYDQAISQKCDIDYQNARSIQEKRNILFIRYFDITYEDALEFIKMYDHDLTGVNVSKTALNYMECIKKILNFKNETSFDEFYYSSSPKYQIDDLFAVENDYQKAYSESLLNNMYKGNNKTEIIELYGKQIEVLKPDNFKLLVHSTNAYSTLPMIDDNFYKSWNLSKRTDNHGICTTLISNTSLGIPPLESNEGCIFAFTEFSVDSITSMAPYDLYSENSEYELITERPSLYSSPQDILDMTRHSFNEVVIERTNLLNNNTINIQPNYVIITNEMNENQINNSLKASQEMNPPIGLPIIYINLEKIINKNKKIILEEMSTFLKTSNCNILKNLINTYESVMCTCFSIDKYEFINSKDIDNLIYIYINKCFNNKDISSLNKIIEILNNEKSKFDIIEEFQTREKNMHLDYKGIMNKILEYKVLLKEELMINQGKQR